MKQEYDVIIIGAGLGGMTAANKLGKMGYSILLIEQHHKIGGLATWFERKGYSFDISLHGFPIGMRSSLRMHWNKVPRNRIIRLTLRYDGREWNILNKDNYIQKKRGSMEPFDTHTFRVESRSIGYYDDNAKVWYTVNENTGKMHMELNNRRQTNQAV